MTNFLKILLCAICGFANIHGVHAFAAGFAAMAASLSVSGTDKSHTVIRGQVFLRDSVDIPADYVTVYSKSDGCGTTSDESGFFELVLDGRDRKVTLEFSRMGYAAQNINVTARGDSASVGSVFLIPQPLMLPAAYVLPKGMTVSQYILSQVWKRARSNRKSMLDYDAHITYDIATHDIPMAAQILSKFKLGITKIAAGMIGWGPLVRYCLTHDDFRAGAELHRRVVNRKASDSSQRLLYSDKELPQDVRNCILSVFKSIDLFDMVYGESVQWGQKFSKTHEFELIGTYEYEGDLVDILQYVDKQTGVAASVHVVEDKWGILKAQVGRGDDAMRCELRDIGDGIFMPVSFVSMPSMTYIKAEDIPVWIEKFKTTKSIDKSTAKRAVKLLEKNLGRDFNPYVSVGCNIKYNRFNIF